MCPMHWKLVPKSMKQKIWLYYRVNQVPSKEWLDILNQAIAVVAFKVSRGTT